MKSESGVHFIKKLKLPKDTHESELREGGPSGSLSTQPCVSEDYLQPALQARASPLRLGSILCPVCALGGQPPPSLTLDQSPSVCPTPSPSSALPCARFMPVSTSSSLFLWLAPLQILSPSPVGGLFPHPVQHRSQRWSWACLGLHCFFQTFILPLSAEKKLMPPLLGLDASTPLSHHLHLPSGTLIPWMLVIW